MKGMEYKDRSGDQNALDQLIEDPRWVFQQKMDGTRTLVNLETMQFSQRNGSPLKHTAATQWIPRLIQELSDLGLSGQANTILDCELMIGDGELYIFDVIDPWDLERPLDMRIAEMEKLPTGGIIQTVTTAKSAWGKREMVKLCERAEGVVAKYLKGGYEPGKRVDTVLKFKNIHSAELIVTRLSEAPKAAGLGILDKGEVHTVANASMIGKDPEIEVGDVVEVNFLAWTGASLLQPRIVRRRPDKCTADCTRDQFKTYSREAMI